MGTALISLTVLCAAASAFSAVWYIVRKITRKHATRSGAVFVSSLVLCVVSFVVFGVTQTGPNKVSPRPAETAAQNTSAPAALPAAPAPTVRQEPARKSITQPQPASTFGTSPENNRKIRRYRDSVLFGRGTRRRLFHADFHCRHAPTP